MLFLAASCGTPVTQLVVLVGTDMAVPDEVAAIRVRTLRADTDVQEELSSRTISLTAESALPMALAVEPDDLMDIGRVIIEVEAQSPTGLRIVARRATTEFVEGDQLAVPLFLRATCRRVLCPSGSTCGEMGCTSQEVPVSSLEPYRGELD